LRTSSSVVVGKFSVHAVGSVVATIVIFAVGARYLIALASFGARGVAGILAIVVRGVHRSAVVTQPASIVVVAVVTSRLRVPVALGGDHFRAECWTPISHGCTVVSQPTPIGVHSHVAGYFCFPVARGGTKLRTSSSIVVGIFSVHAVASHVATIDVIAVGARHLIGLAKLGA